MAGLLTPLETEFNIGDLRVPNRLVIQPMECCDSLEGFPSDLTLQRYTTYAKGGAGIVIVEACSVTDKSRARLHQLVVDKSHQDGITKLVKTFNENKTNPDSLLFVQITHSGSVSDPRFSEVVRVCEPKSPDNTPGRILNKEDIKEIVGSFVDAAEVAYKAGANGVDVKCCHGYLLGQFLRPANTRNDDYGGILENRMRIVGEVIKGIRERVKDSKFKIMLRFSAYEGIPGGIGARTSDEQPFKQMK